MLAGVGGRTIAEAKQRISYAEAQDWAEFIRRRGSLHVGLRLEQGFAMLRAAINNALGGSATMRDYMPHFDEPETDLETAMKEWR